MHGDETMTQNGSPFTPSEEVGAMVESLGDEADLCRNETADDIADLLDGARALLLATEQKRVEAEREREEWRNRARNFPLLASAQLAAESNAKQHDKAEAESAKLRAALRPLAAIPLEDFSLQHADPQRPIIGWNDHQLTVGDVLAARAAVGRGP